MAEKYNICLDIGGTKVLGAVFDSKDNIVFTLTSGMEIKA